MLLRRAPILIQAHQLDEARASTLRGLSLLRAQAERPQAGPTDKNEYASWLLTCEPADVRRPSEALRFAQAAVAASATPVYLDTLALANFNTGNRELAIATGERALAALPPLKPGEKATALRAEVEGHVTMFRADGTLDSSNGASPGWTLGFRAATASISIERYGRADALSILQDEQRAS